MSPSENLPSKLHVLVVDDDIFIADLIKIIAEKQGCIVKCIHDGNEVGNALIAYEPDVIFLDLILPGIDGVEIIRALSRVKCKAKIVLMSGLDKRTLSSVSEVATKNQLDMIGAITKPFGPGQLEGILQPLVDLKNRVPTGMDAGQSSERFGPRLFYEPEVYLKPSPSNTMSWMRARLMWRLDDAQIVDMSKLLLDSAKPKLARGLIELTLREYLVDSTRRHSDKFKLGIKFPILDNLLEDDTTPDFLDRLVRSSQLSNQALMFEMNESAVVNSSEATINVLSRLKIKGFKLAVCVKEHSDKILALLKKLPIDEIVVDMFDNRFRDSTINNTETEFQVGSLVSYASAADLTTSVKNVTSQQQILFAKRCKFTRASGISICESAEFDEVVKFLNNPIY